MHDSGPGEVWRQAHVCHRTGVFNKYEQEGAMGCPFQVLPSPVQL